MKLPPHPWKKLGIVSVGGLRTVGFDRNSELLLVVSSAGRGVIDCTTCAKLARDDAEYYDHEEFLEADGIGPLSGTMVHMSGILGGGLPTTTQDRWSLEVITLEWTENNILLVEPYCSIYDVLYNKPPKFKKIGRESELTACGFSFTGNTFIVASSSDITVFGRING
ncbi:hypothetical protein [Chromobacterium violaceum]|uniref:hypothetical protein n=1 Tax=Chromobacterium violaceum TaxID=536 RepID=UPI003CEC1670